MSAFAWVCAAIITVLSAARLIRLAIWDKYPPMIWIRVRWAVLTKEGPWEELLKCGYCFAIYPTTAIVLWGYLTDWQSAWWITNGILAAAYLAPMVVTFDGELVD